MAFATGISSLAYTSVASSSALVQAVGFVLRLGGIYLAAYGEGG